MNDVAENPGTLSLQRCRVILVVIPDDGRDRALMSTLLVEKNITTTESHSCRGINMLRETRAKPGRLPESTMVRVVTIFVPEDRADEVFDFVYHQAGIGRPGGGGIFMGESIQCTPYTLPPDVPPEASREPSSSRGQ